MQDEGWSGIAVAVEGHTRCNWKCKKCVLFVTLSLVRGLMHILSSSSSSVICQTIGPKPLAKRFLHIVRSTASSFNSQYPLLSLRSSSNFLRLLTCRLVTSICPFIFPSITCFRRQFLRKMWPIQLAFRFIISCRIFLCSLKDVPSALCTPSFCNDCKTFPLETLPAGDPNGGVVYLRNVLSPEEAYRIYIWYLCFWKETIQKKW